MRGRTNTMTTVASKTAASTSKRAGGGGQVKLTSGTTRISSSGTASMIGLNPQEANRTKSMKMITEVDGIFTKK
jgi:hypothetical protein